MKVNLDAAILLSNIDTESMKVAQQQRDPFLLRLQDGKQLTVEEIRAFLKATPEDFTAAIDVLHLELELSKSANTHHDEEH